MKNTLKKLILVLGAGLFLTSCEDMLDVKPVDKLTPDNYFRTEGELELYSNRFYNNILPGGATIYKEIGDNMIWTPLENEISCQRTVPEKGGGYTFTTLRQVNFFLEHLGNCTDKKAVAKYRGIAKFFRAWFYFDMVKRFGDVPWVDHVPASDDAVLYAPRDSREVVMDHVMQDLNDALIDLEKTKSKKDVYRVHWWTVQALKSRAGLFEGTFRKYHGLGNYEKYLNAAVEASEAFLAGGYSLADSYREIFISNNASKEYIFARDYDRLIDLNNGVYNTFNSPGQGRASFTRKFINTYLMSDGRRFTDPSVNPNWETMEFKDEIEGRDGRLTQTIRTYSLNFNACLTGYQPKKYIADEAFFSTEHAYNDLPLFRLAEIYLNYAEAKAELGTLTQDDLDATVNKLRERAGFAPSGYLDMVAANNDPDPYLCSAETGYGTLGALSTPNKGVILEIRRERNIELVQESQQRYYDLMRWKEGKCITQTFGGIFIPEGKVNAAYDVDGDGNADVCVYNTPERPTGVSAPTFVQLSGDGIKLSNGTSGNMVFFSFLTRNWNEDRDYLYPIPNEDIVLTNGVVKQNPGW